MNRACLSALGLLVACHDASRISETERTLEEPLSWHSRHGYVRLEPVAHPPSSSSRQDQVETWVKIPGGITRGRYGLTMPPQTQADRVEFRNSGSARRIVDIRGTEILNDGQSFHVYRPTASRSSASLYGVHWSRGDTSGRAASLQRMVKHLERSPPGKHMAASARSKYLARFQEKSDCASCHSFNRAENRVPRQWGLVNRGTDGSGFFGIYAVLQDRVALESYGDFDRSLDDPALDVACWVDGARQGPPHSRRCARGIAMATIDWSRAWSQTPQRARQICASRRYLVERMEPPAKAQYRRALTPCAGR